MKHKFSKLATNVVSLLPKNIRSITEYSFKGAHSKNLKVGIISTFSVFLLALIFLQGVTLWYNLKQEDVYVQEREHLEKEVAYWQSVADKYQGYRDVYYRIASLQFKLGNTDASKEYVQKALELDPNFPEGRVLGTKVGLE